MNEISHNALAARVAAASSVSVRSAQAAGRGEAAPAEKAETPASAGSAVQAVQTESNAVEPQRPAARTRVTGYADDSSGRYVLQVRETESDEVVSQYPPAELLRFYAAAREALERAIERAAGSKDVSA